MDLHKKLILLWSLLVLCILPALTQDPDLLDEEEDDVILNEEQLRAYRALDQDRDWNITVASSPPKWNKKWFKTPRKPYRVIVPIKIRKSDYTKEALATFEAGLRDIEEKTCVRFVSHVGRPDYIFVHNDGGKCNSPLGKQGGQQPLRLTNGCMLVRKKCVHEIMHALGFHHMHQRYDRDNFITIQWYNAEVENRKWFNKFNNKWEAFNTPYDHFSAMHYGRKAFSKNGFDTIKTKNPVRQDKIGNAFTLSRGDVQRIVRMYRCPGQYWEEL